MTIHTPMIFCTSRHRYPESLRPGSCGPFTVHLIYLCVSASFASLIFSVTPFTLLCTPTPLPPPPTWMPPTFPPSAAIVISRPSAGPLIRLGWHVPRLYHTRRKWNPEPIYGVPPNAPPPPRFLSPWPLHLGTSSSSPVPRCSPSLLQHGLISLPLSPSMNPHPAPPPPTLTLCPPFTSLCQAWICPPPSPVSSSLTQRDLYKPLRCSNLRVCYSSYLQPEDKARKKLDREHGKRLEHVIKETGGG